MAHCVQCGEEEIRSMAENGVIAVHCPDSNVNICSGTAPVRHLLESGVWVTLGSDIAGGAQLPMNQVSTASLRARTVRHMTDPDAPPFLTAAEGYYLGAASGHRYFGAGPGFAPGDKLHALVLDDSAFPEPASPLSLPERLERALYLMTPDSITARWSEGRLLP